MRSVVRHGRRISQIDRNGRLTPYPRDIRRLLRVGDAQHSEQAAGAYADECLPVHH
jgi:hypothetical protein